MWRHGRRDMTVAESPVTRRAGRPRSEEADRAILDAALDALVDDGYAGHVHRRHRCEGGRRQGHRLPAMAGQGRDPRRRAEPACLLRRAARRHRRPARPTCSRSCSALHQNMVGAQGPVMAAFAAEKARYPELRDEFDRVFVAGSPRPPPSHRRRGRRTRRPARRHRRRAARRCRARAAAGTRSRCATIPGPSTCPSASSTSFCADPPTYRPQRSQTSRAPGWVIGPRSSIRYRARHPRSARRSRSPVRAGIRSNAAGRAWVGVSTPSAITASPSVCAEPHDGVRQCRHRRDRRRPRSRTIGRSSRCRSGSVEGGSTTSDPCRSRPPRVAHRARATRTRCATRLRRPDPWHFR